MDDEAEAAKEAEERAAKKAAAAAAEAEKAAEEAEKAEKAKALWKKAVEKVDTRLLCVIGRRLARCEPFAVRIGRHQLHRVHGAQADAHLQGRAARRRQGAEQVHAQGSCGEAQRQHRVELSKLLGQRAGMQKGIRGVYPQLPYPTQAPQRGEPEVRWIVEIDF